MMSAEYSLRLQNMVPSIMHTSREEKAISTPPPRGMRTELRAMVITTKAMVRDRRLELEKKIFSSQVKSAPIPAPSSREQRISSRGFSTTLTAFRLPPSMAPATPMETAKITRPTASSRATMGSSRLVTGPLALYWRTTISVAAGAVAAAMAPRVTATGRGSVSGPTRKYRPISAASTSRLVNSAWAMPMTVAVRPVLRSWARRNSLPMSKAIKPRATLDSTATCPSSSMEAKPSPGRPKAPRQKGPTSTPAIRKAVTSGKRRCRYLNTRVIISPANRAKAVAKSTRMGKNPSFIGRLRPHSFRCPAAKTQYSTVSAKCKGFRAQPGVCFIHSHY